jgi:hypothetical protein
MESFKVTSLDMSDITEEDLQAEKSTSYIKTPGRYDLRVISHKMGVKKTPDAAGKQWGWLAITAENQAGELVSGIIDVPLEALAYTSANGKKSNLKTRIFVNFLRSIGVTNTAMSEIGNHVNNLSNLLEARPSFTANLGNTQDFVEYRGKDGDRVQYGIRMKDGSALLNEDGVEVIVNSFNEAVEYYRSFKGYNPQTGLVYKSFIA